ncbi:MAG: hypothetical protein SGPRY_006666, partial [Prymnesium sp.]
AEQDMLQLRKRSKMSTASSGRERHAEAEEVSDHSYRDCYEECVFEDEPVLSPVIEEGYTSWGSSPADRQRERVFLREGHGNMMAALPAVIPEEDTYASDARMKRVYFASDARDDAHITHASPFNGGRLSEPWSVPPLSRTSQREARPSSAYASLSEEGHPPSLPLQRPAEPPFASASLPSQSELEPSCYDTTHHEACHARSSVTCSTDPEGGFSGAIFHEGAQDQSAPHDPAAPTVRVVLPRATLLTAPFTADSCDPSLSPRAVPSDASTPPISPSIRNPRDASSVPAALDAPTSTPPLGMISCISPQAQGAKTPSACEAGELHEAHPPASRAAAMQPSPSPPIPTQSDERSEGCNGLQSNGMVASYNQCPSPALTGEGVEGVNSSILRDVLSSSLALINNSAVEARLARLEAILLSGNQGLAPLKQTSLGVEARLAHLEEVEKQTGGGGEEGPLQRKATAITVRIGEEAGEDSVMEKERKETARVEEGDEKGTEEKQSDEKVRKECVREEPAREGNVRDETAWEEKVREEKVREEKAWEEKVKEAKAREEKVRHDKAREQSMEEKLLEEKMQRQKEIEEKAREEQAREEREERERAEKAWEERVRAEKAKEEKERENQVREEREKQQKAREEKVREEKIREEMVREEKAREERLREEKARKEEEDAREQIKLALEDAKHGNTKPADQNHHEHDFCSGVMISPGAMTNSRIKDKHVLGEANAVWFAGGEGEESSATLNTSTRTAAHRPAEEGGGGERADSPKPTRLHDISAREMQPTTLLFTPRQLALGSTPREAAGSLSTRYEGVTSCQASIPPVCSGAGRDSADGHASPSDASSESQLCNSALHVARRELQTARYEITLLQSHLRTTRQQCESLQASLSQREAELEQAHAQLIQQVKQSGALLGQIAALVPSTQR